MEIKSERLNVVGVGGQCTARGEVMIKGQAKLLPCHPAGRFGDGHSD